MGPYDLGRRRTRGRPLLRSGGRKGPQPRGIRDATARAERRVGHACLRRRTGSGKPHGSTGSDGSAGPRVLGRAPPSAAHGRTRGLPSSTRGRSRMDERPGPDLCGGCAVLRIPTVTGGGGARQRPLLPGNSILSPRPTGTGPVLETGMSGTVPPKRWFPDEPSVHQDGVNEGGGRADVPSRIVEGAPVH